ncbi:GTP-Hypothetical protein protein [Nesidiocoris tenuis]|uniref:Hflx-type G domain-containing protein n=1 Tax=Nesidiocoris tenuis TaxID=355587 RepID=A0ABN7ALW4_9HEMI|nr:GTP-Hypothetical protein protein [Nesidiocoris tenuis]
MLAPIRWKLCSSLISTASESNIFKTRKTAACRPRKTCGCQIARNYANESDTALEDEELVISDLGKSLRSIRLAGDPHQVYLIQPYIKWGPQKDHLTPPELKLEEAEALIRTLPRWTVVKSRIVPLTSFDRKSFFGEGNLNDITWKTRSLQTITSVFINTKSLKLPQHLFLEQAFGVPVFDRHSIVINIFKKHAKTKEAKLQVALAEIPYFWSRIRGINESEIFDVSHVGIGGAGTFEEKRLTILKERERKIKEEIKRLRANRELLRAKRQENELPTVAIVGYTNAGKTSLIKALTSEEGLTPEDKLFATLDVTVHATLLPTNVKILLVDTIGFISDIPTNLLEPFVATLEDAILADVIVHVQDVSHPNSKAQEETVLKTLKSLDLPESLMNSIISVGNKVDKLGSNAELPENILPISCKDGRGLDELLDRIEDQVYKNTGMKKMKIKVPNGGEEYQWLQRNASIFGFDEDPKNSQTVILSLAITKAKLEKFKHEFILKKAKGS